MAVKKQKKHQKISDHFSRRDFQCHSDPRENQFKISAGLVGALELLRSKANNRINIIKGFQTVASAEKEGNVKRNFHTQGLAANITIENMSIQEVFLLAEEIPEITGIGLNEHKNYVHIRVNKAKTRTLFIDTGSLHDVELTPELREKHRLIKKPYHGTPID